MAFYCAYVFLLLFLNFRLRVRAVKKGMHGSYFKAFQGTDVPDQVIIFGRHIDNQFQAPLYFMVSCLAAAQAGAVTGFTLTCAWLFVLSRMYHSYIHLGSNKVLRRAKIYAFGWLFIFLIWGQVLVSVF